MYTLHYFYYILEKLYKDNHMWASQAYITQLS